MNIKITNAGNAGKDGRGFHSRPLLCKEGIKGWFSIFFANPSAASRHLPLERGGMDANNLFKHSLAV